MHGVSKSALSDEQKRAKQVERQKKLERFVNARDVVLKKMKQSEYDDDGLKVTEAILAKNPDLYMFWNYRKLAILAKIEESNSTPTKPEEPLADQDGKKKVDVENYFQNELLLTEECLRDNPKSYGAWYHRQWILEKYFRISSRSASILKSELRHCDEGLKYDERNFHCWDHRRFVCQLASVPEIEELTFSKGKIDENFSNYSAWHYRSSLLQRLFPPGENDSTLRIQEEKSKEELVYAQNAFFTDPEDQSAWFYHCWLFRPAEFRIDENPTLHYFRFESTKPARVSVVFSCPVKINRSKSNLQILVDNTVILADGWSTPDGSRCGQVWSNGQLTQEVTKVFSEMGSTLKILLRDRVIEEISIDTANGFEWISSDFNPRKYLQPILSPAFRNSLENSMAGCQDLRRVEPASNKWPLLTEILSMRWLDLLKFKTEIFSGFDELTRSDSRKRAYYEDMKSKFVVETKILDCITENTAIQKLELNNSDLTALPSIRTIVLMISIQELNLNNNRLTSLAPLAYLINLMKLSADGNDLENTNGLGNLLYLEFLSLARNNLWPEFTNSLKPLKNGRNLKELNLMGNSFGEEMTSEIRSFLGKTQDELIIQI